MNHSFILAITVISAQGLKDSPASRIFTYRRLRPFATITTTPPPYQHKLAAATRPMAKSRTKLSEVYKTKVDYRGGTDPTWDDKFELPLDTTFFDYQRHSCIYLHVYTKRFLFGNTQLGWCEIPVTDILDGLSPVGSLRHLAYQLRARDRSRGHGIVNVAAKVETALPVDNPQWSFACSGAHSPKMNATDQIVMGIPISH